MSAAPMDWNTYRASYMEAFGDGFDTCASCGQPIRPPEQFYVHELTGDCAHVVCP